MKGHIFFVTLAVMLQPSVSFEQIFTDSPRLLIASGGKAITRNTRRLTDIRAVSAVNSIHVIWNMTPASAEGLPCCSFTLLETYPLNSFGGKSTGESVILLKPNVTRYTVKISHISPEMDVPDYLVCIRLWHRFGGKEKKMDESCIKVKLVLSENKINVVAIVFAAAVGVNVTLLTGLIVFKIVKWRKSNSQCRVKRWWKDNLHQQRSRSSLESSLTIVPPERRPSGLSGSLNNGMSVPGSPSVQSLGERRLGGINTVSATVAENEYTYSCLNNQVYDLFLHRVQQQPRTPSVPLYMVRNGWNNDPAQVAVV